MPIYLYTARDNTGNLLHGTQEAENEYAAVKILQGRDFLITNITGSALELQTAKRSQIKKHHGVKSSDLLFFIRQTATLLDAGVPLVRALEVVSGPIESEILDTALRSIITDIKAGSTFKGAISKQPKIFPFLWVFLIEAGETSGNLPLVLEQLAHHIEAGINLKTKVVSALVYPAVVMTVALGAILIFLLKIIPIFSKLFASFNAKLPPITLAVIAVSSFLQHYILYLAALLAAGVYLLRFYLATPAGQRVKDNFVINIPLFGQLIRDAILARISMNLSTLIKSGVNLLESIDISARTAGNSFFKIALKNVERDIKQGKSLSVSLSENAIFPSMIVQMVLIGEESGRLTDMMKKVAEYYEARVDVFLTRLSALIEPVILVVVGGIIALLVVAMYMPIFSLSSVVK